MEKEKCDRVHARLFKITPFMECFYKKRVKNPLLYFAIAKYLLKNNDPRSHFYHYSS